MLMTLPALDSITQIGGLVTISWCPVLSMVTSFVSIFWYKSEMAQGSALTAGEGFVLLPVSVILCLGPHRQSLTTDVSAPKHHAFTSTCVPCIFCCWIHHGHHHIHTCFRSATINFAYAEIPVAAKFDEYAWWMVIGVLGALTWVLIASVMVSRR